MPVSHPSPGRPAARKNSILGHLRRQIADGTWAPGSQIPTRSEISEQFGASPVTVQSALEHLRRDGFIEVRGRNGTFVASRPPHLTNYALAFCQSPSGPDWSRFWTALAQEAVGLERESGHHISVYYHVAEQPQSEDYRRLTQEVKARKLAGIVFGSIPLEVRGTPILTEPGTPRVAIMSQEFGMDLPYVKLNGESFWEKALDFLASRGRRRLAILTSHRELENQQVIALAKKRGFECHPHWTHSVSRINAPAARNLVHLLLHQHSTIRPDALVVGDDNLVEHATAGIIASGSRVPTDLEVVTHCNFPYPAPSVIPALRLGFDAREVLQECIAVLDAQRSGKPPARCTTIAARLEDSLLRPQEVA